MQVFTHFMHFMVLARVFFEIMVGIRIAKQIHVNCE